jgi:FkbM family methyltransferase
MPDQVPDAATPFVFHPQARADIESVFRFEDYPLNRIAFSHVQAIADIGAHCGAFSVLCASLYPTAPIRAYEPLRINHELAAQNTAHLPRVDLRQVGLSDYNGNVDIYYSPAFGFAASSSVRTHDHTDGFETASIRRASEELADLGPITILKIDTEGHELRILTDISGSLHQVSVLFLEIHSDADRRHIDALLGTRFVLFYSRCDMTNRYKLSYVNRDALATGQIQVATAPELCP